LIGGDSEAGKIVGYCVAALAGGGFTLSVIKYVLEVIPEREALRKKKRQVEPEPESETAGNELTSVAVVPSS